jgi:hypothetical protein
MKYEFNVGFVIEISDEDKEELLEYCEGGTIEDKLADWFKEERIYLYRSDKEDFEDVSINVKKHREGVLL